MLPSSQGEEEEDSDKSDVESGKGRGKGKAKLQAATERDEQVKAMRCLIKAYLSRKSLADSPSRVIVSGQIVQDLTICAEEEKLFIKVCTILIRSVLVAMTVSHLCISLPDLRHSY